MYTPLSTVNYSSGIEVYKGDNIKKLSERLKKSGLIRSERIFTYVFLSISQARNLKSGHYAVNEKDTIYDLISRIASGEVLQESFTIIEGWTWSDLWSALKNDGRFIHSSEESIKKYFNDLKVFKNNLFSLEGLFQPDTYHFAKGIKDRDLLLKAFDAQKNFLDIEWSARSKSVGDKSIYEFLTVASLIEKETSIADEYRIIAGIIYNRLNLNMPIQIDASVLYGRSKKNGSLTKKDLKERTLYNTYIHKNLPPTPISMPSRDAIIASMHPVKTNYLYYVAQDNGSHKFNIKFSDHVRSKNIIQKKRSLINVK